MSLGPCSTSILDSTTGMVLVLMVVDVVVDVEVDVEVVAESEHNPEVHGEKKRGLCRMWWNCASIVLPFTTVYLPCYIELTSAILFSVIFRETEVGGK